LLIVLCAVSLFFIDTHLDLELMEDPEMSVVSTGMPVPAWPSYNNFQHNDSADEDDQPHNRGLDVQDDWVNTLVCHISYKTQGSAFQLIDIDSSKSPTLNLQFSPPLLL